MHSSFQHQRNSFFLHPLFPPHFDPGRLASSIHTRPFSTYLRPRWLSVINGCKLCLSDALAKAAQRWLRQLNRHSKVCSSSILDTSTPYVAPLCPWVYLNSSIPARTWRLRLPLQPRASDIHALPKRSLSLGPLDGRPRSHRNRHIMYRPSYTLEHNQPACAPSLIWSCQVALSMEARRRV